MDLATHIESELKGFPVSRNLGINISREKINIEKKKNLNLVKVSFKKLSLLRYLIRILVKVQRHYPNNFKNSKTL